MSQRRYHVAQANIALMRAPLEDPIMESFRSQLDRINAIADQSPGFVWRLQTHGGNATAIRAYEDERLLFNMSVWETVEALHAYVYRSNHAGPLRARRNWFATLEGPILVLWWIASGHVPSVVEGKARLELLKVRGPSQEAFTFRDPFPPPGGRPVKLPEVDAELCDLAT